jgi:DNA helicase HerA-like ATPase/DNA-binding transcriptional ArsR family regulator
VVPLKTGSVLYELTPRVGAATPPPDVFGYRFTYCLLSDGERLRVLVETPVSGETLQRFFGVRRASLEELLGLLGGGTLYVAEARLRRAQDFWFSDYGITDLPGLVNQLAEAGTRGGVCVAVSRDPALTALFARRAASLAQRAARYGNQALRLQSKELSRRARDVVLGRVVLLAADRGARKTLESLVEASSLVPVRWVRKSVGDAKSLAKLLEPAGVPLTSRLLGWGLDYPVLAQGTLRETVRLPDPSLHRVGFVRGYPLPAVVPARTGEGTFRVGVLEDGRELRLSLEDLYRHVYVIGQTGSGKTTFLKLLVHRLRELGGVSVVVVDPHGDMARELAEEIPEALYLHPIRSPFGLNPLDLPKHEDRGYAVTVAIDILIEMFKEVLKLMETAVNVKYLLQVLLRAFYSKTDSPTLAMLYSAILGLYRGELDLDVDDPEWERQLEALQRMQDQTFISALSRLEPYAHDRLLLKLTSRTTLDFERIMSPGSTTVFSVPKADLGEGLARLVASTIVMKLWFEVLARARLGRPRTPVFLVVDEFQFVADLPIIDTILSEARKYGLHLVVAHQHTKQIPDQLLQSVMSNCAVKVAFQVGGEDIRRLSTMDASFANALARALTGLTVGRAVVKLTAGPGEQQPPPVVAQLDYVEHAVRRRDIYTRAYDPGEPRAEDLRGLLNPVLKYIEPVRPLEFFALYMLRKHGPLAIADLATRLGARREDVEDAVSSLAGRGYVEVYREGNRRMVRYVKGLLRGVRRVAPSEDGYGLARRVLLHYARRGYVVAPARQGPDLPARPDLVAVPVDRATWRPLYSRAIAIEVESCNEVGVHPEQVVRNWVKESVRDFAEVHAWTWEECFERLRRLYEGAGVDRTKVKVFKAGRPGKVRGAGATAATTAAPAQPRSKAIRVSVRTTRGEVVEVCVEPSKLATLRVAEKSGVARVGVEGGATVVWDSKGRRFEVGPAVC